MTTTTRKSTPLSDIPMMNNKKAQIAAEHMTPPSELISDDDMTIKELLNKFNNGAAVEAVAAQSQVAAPSPSPSPSIPPAASPPPLRPVDEADVEASFVDRLMNHYVTDAELLVLFFASYLLVSCAPIGQLVSKYVYSFPNASLVDLLSKSAAATLLAYVSYLCVTGGGVRS